MRLGFLAVCLLVAGCGVSQDPANPFASDPPKTLREAREGFVTKIVRTGDPAGPPEEPPPGVFELIKYPSAVGPLAAYVTPDPGDGEQHKAMIWITGGDCNSIGDVWSPADRSNDQSARAFREAGMVMMFPSLRGGNNNPGQREGFYGEVDDVLQAAEYLTKLPYVDPKHIYLGGHSTGGTLAMLVGEYSDRFKAIYALGPVAVASQYGGEFIYCDPRDEREVALRSPLFWLKGVKSPMYVFEGAVDGNWEAIQMMADQNKNSLVQFFKVPGFDHFSLIAPLAERIAPPIVNGSFIVTPATVDGLR